MLGNVVPNTCSGPGLTIPPSLSTLSKVVRAREGRNLNTKTVLIIIQFLLKWHKSDLARHALRIAVWRHWSGCADIFLAMRISCRVDREVARDCTCMYVTHDMTQVKHQWNTFWACISNNGYHSAHRAMSEDQPNIDACTSNGSSTSDIAVVPKSALLWSVWWCFQALDLLKRLCLFSNHIKIKQIQHLMA